MTQEEITKNIIDTLKAVETLEPEHQKEVEKILELMTKSFTLIVDEKKTNEAIETCILPLLYMLCLDFLQEYIAKNLPPEEALKMLTTSLFSSMGKKNHEN